LFEDDLDDLSNWGTTTGWDLSSTEYVSSPTSIRGDSNAAYLISDPIDTTSYSEITVTFKYYITGIDVNDDVYVSYWDGAAYDNIEEIGDDAEGSWLTYSDELLLSTSAEADYFNNAFKIRVRGSKIDNNEYIYIDDVSVVGE